MKRLFIFILFLIFSCITKNTIIEETTTTTTTTSTTTTTTIIIFKKVFKYDVPEDMTESPYEAIYYNYDNLLIDKNSNVFDSTIIIAIRHSENRDNISLIDFAQKDIESLKYSIKINYLEKWDPPLFEGKNLEYVSYELYYFYDKKNIYQRSIYLKCDNLFYIVSLSSKNKRFMLDEENNKFWQSIRIEEMQIAIKGETSD